MRNTSSFQCGGTSVGKIDSHWPHASGTSETNVVVLLELSDSSFPACSSFTSKPSCSSHEFFLSTACWYAFTLSPKRMRLLWTI